MDDTLARKQRERGYSDGKAGHSPALLKGPYMDGFVQGRSGNDLDHNFRTPPDPKDARIDALEAENETLRKFVRSVLDYDPRSDIYATELHGDALEALGYCRCCGEEACIESSE